LLSALSCNPSCDVWVMMRIGKVISFDDDDGLLFIIYIYIPRYFVFCDTAIQPQRYSVFADVGNDGASLNNWKCQFDGI